MKKLAFITLSRFRELTPISRVRIVLILLASVLFIILLAARKPWSVEIDPEKGAKVSQYVTIYLWIALLIDFALVALLAATAQWWLRPCTAALPVPSSSLQAPRWFWPLVIGAMVLNAALCWPRLGHSFWHDETYPIRNAILGVYKQQKDGSVKLKQVSWTETFFFYKKPNHTLYSGIARACNDLWRTVAKPKGLQFNETVIRLPAYLAGIASVWAIALLLSELECFSAGVIAAYLYAIHPWHIRYASEARAYGFVLMLVPLLIFCFLRVLKSGHWKWWTAFGLAQFFLIYFYPTCVYILVVLNLCMIPALCWRWGRSADTLSQGLRWVVTNIAAAMLFLPVILPCVPQFLEYVKTTSGQGSMTLEWLLNFLAHLLAGLPWAYKGYYEPKQVELYWWFLDHPGLGALIVFLAIAFVVTGVRRLFAKDRIAALVPWILILPAAICFAETRARGGHIHVWYLIFLLPGVVALAALGLDEILSAARTTSGKIAAGALVLFLMGSYTAWTTPERDALLGRSIQPNRESVLATRPTLDPHDPRQRQIITATFYGPPEPYDPNIITFRTATELGELTRRADAEGKQLFINLGYLTTVEGEHPNKYALLKKSGLFETVPLASGYEPTLQSRHVFKYRNGSARDFDFSTVPPDQGRPGSNYSY